jgi:membrane fusion protein, copper/silver efflux system
LINFTMQALPGSSFNAKIQFIDPVIDPVNRVAKVRVEIGNPGAKLKPEMFAAGIVKSNLNQYSDNMVIPRSAVLWTGKRSIVYVKQPGIDEPVFKIREVELGPQLDNSYVILNGLADGEEIVTQSAFSVDAAAQLEGKPSMMNPSGDKDSNMPGMDMPDMVMSKTKAKDKIDHQMIHVSGNCDQCKARIETAAKSVTGVVSAEWNIATKKLLVQFDDTKTNSDAIEKTIAQAGHDTERYKAPDDVYNKLPECCLYRK